MGVDKGVLGGLNPGLTLRGLNLFLKMFPISNVNAGVSVAYIFATIHFLHTKLGSWSTTSTN